MSDTIYFAEIQPSPSNKEGAELVVHYIALNQK